MNKVLAALPALLIACSAAPPRPLPLGGDWIKGTAVHVSKGPELKFWPEMRELVEQDLRLAGFRILSQPEKGELNVVISKYDGSNLHVLVDRDGERVDQLEFNIDNLSCGVMTIDAQCASREVAARLLEAPRLGAAMQKKAPVRAAPQPSSGKLAVLELRNFTTDLTAQNAAYFTDLVRSAALRMQPGLEIMTRENLVVLLQASGKRLEECEGECEVDTGRRIGADRIVTGELQKVGSSFKMSLRLHDTHAGRLLSSHVASGKTVDELDAAAQKAAEQLFAGR